MEQMEARGTSWDADSPAMDPDDDDFAAAKAFRADHRHGFLIGALVLALVGGLVGLGVWQPWGDAPTTPKDVAGAIDTKMPTPRAADIRTDTRGAADVSGGAADVPGEVPDTLSPDVPPDVASIAEILPADVTPEAEAGPDIVPADVPPEVASVPEIVPEDITEKIEPPKEDPPKEDPPKEDPPKEDPPKEDPPNEDPPKEDPPKKDPGEDEYTEIPLGA